MMKRFNNYSLSNEEIEKILYLFENIINVNSKIDGVFNEECAQQIRLAIYRKLHKNYKKI